MTPQEKSPGKKEEVVMTPLSNSVMLCSTHSTTATSSLDSDFDDDSLPRHQYAKVPFRHPTEQLKDHSERLEDTGNKSPERSQRKKGSGRRRSRSRSRTRRRSRSGSVEGRNANPSKSSRSLKPKRDSKLSGKQQLPTQQQLQASYANSFAILPPADLSSSNHKSINLLVCTANLGNAPPDEDSWNAWIPKDGKLIPTTQFPVRMNPPPPPPQQPSLQKKPQPPGSPRAKSFHQRERTHSGDLSQPKPQERRHSGDLSGSQPKPRERRHSGDLSGSQPKPRKPARRGNSKDPNPDSRPNNSTSRKIRKAKSQDSDDATLTTPKANEPEQESYEAYLESLKGSTYSFDEVEDASKRESPKDSKNTTTTTTWKRVKGKQQGDHERKRDPPRRARSKQETADEASPTSAREENSKRDKAKAPAKSEPRRGVRRGRSNDLALPVNPSTPKGRKPRSKSIDATKLLESPSTPSKSPRTPNEKLRRVIRSKSSTMTDLHSPTSASPRQRKFLRSKSVQQELGTDAEESPNLRARARKMVRSKSPMQAGLARSKSPTRAGLGRTRSKSSKDAVASNDRSGKGSSSAEVSNVPPCRRINEAEIAQAEIEGIKKFEIRYPAHSYVSDSGTPNQENLGYYDIIVIGMQEATFSTSDQNMKQEESTLKQQQKQQRKSLNRAASFDDTTVDTDDFLDSDEESDDGDTSDEGSVLTDDGEILDGGEDEIETPNEGSKSARMRKRMSRKKQGKAPKGEKKGGLLKQISKAKKTVDTFAGGGKDHTARPLRTSKALAGGQEPSDLTIERSETFSSTDLEEDFSTPDGSAVAKAKKWTDTDVLHNGIESNQLQGYTRALSYQFGQMRLLVYYKAGADDSSVLRSLDVLSVKYQGTGKAGLANKGGIVAEVAVNKTTKFSFLTAHLEAHEGAKHYRARNDSFRDILMDTGSSKYFDASLSSHFTFAMGDLNYRTKLADVAVGSDRHIQFSHNIVDRRDWRTLNQYDELRKSLAKKLVLSGFQTAYCNFPPTFKVDRQHGYRYNPKRSPSYTDRILFKNADQLDAATKLILYEPVEGFTSSDHKPIRGGFSIRLNRELKWKSTAELLLAREEKHNKSLDDLRGILPAVSKGNIDADRETMNFFITNIECVVNPNNYDQIRKQDKAELPSPKLFFITKPSQAVVLQEESKKRLFGIGSRSKSSKENPNSSTQGDNTKKSKDAKLPSTSTCKETMRPIWKDGHVFFSLQTHTEHGRPIDFTGSQLHISLVDTKNNNSAIGSHCLNLAHLIIRSRENPAKQLLRSSSLHHMGKESQSNSKRLERMGSKKRMGNNSERPASQRRLSSERQGSSRRLSNERPGSSRRLGMDRPGSSRRLAGAANEKFKPQPTRGGPKPSPAASGYQLAVKPSPAMRAAAASSLKFGSSMESNSTLPPAVRKAAEAIHRNESGASKLYDSIMADLGGKGSSEGTQNKSEDIGIRSLRLQETLIEGGLVTGQIKCDIDVWWT